jgi:hypothetical protein
MTSNKKLWYPGKHWILAIALYLTAGGGSMVLRAAEAASVADKFASGGRHREPRSKHINRGHITL